MPSGQYNIFELSTGSVVGISTTATVGLSTTSVIGLTTTSNVGLTTTSNVGLTTTSVVGLSTSGGAAPFGMYPPPATDVVAAQVGSTGLIIGIPPNRVWYGSLYASITARTTVGSAGTAINAVISTVGATVTPAAGSILVAVAAIPDSLGMTSSTQTAPAAVGTQSAVLHGVLIAVGSSSASLSLSKSAVNTQSANFSGAAMGWLL